MKRLAESARRQAKQQGFGLGAIEKYFAKHIDPQVSWVQLFRRWKTNVIRKMKYVLPDRRAAGRGQLMYGVKQDKGVSQVVLAVDTSASVGPEELDVFTSEFRSMLKETNVSDIRVAYFHTDVWAVDKFKSASTVNIKRVNLRRDLERGGTLFQPVLDWMKKKRMKPEIFIWMTDGHSALPQKPRGNTEFLWMIVDNPDFEAPFGKVIHVTTAKS